MRSLAIATCLFLLFLFPLSQATSAEIPLDVSSWRTLSPWGGEGSLEKAGNALRVYGSGAREGTQAYFTQSQDFRNATLYIKWRAHGPSGHYAAWGVGVGWLASDSTLPLHVLGAATAGYGVPVHGAGFSTDHSWSGSRVIADDTWHFTRIKVSMDYSVTAVTTTSNYDDKGGAVFYTYSYSLPEESWESLKQGLIFANFNDNYGGKDAWLEIESVSVELAGEPAPPPTTAIPLPNTSQMMQYDPMELPVTGFDPVSIKPIGVGNIATGDENLDLRIALEAFEGPVDLFFAVCAHMEEGDLCFQIDATNTLQPLALPLVPWRSGVTNAVDEMLFGRISTELLPSASYDFYLLATPSGSLDRYYLWVTRIVGPGYVGNFNGMIVSPGATLIHFGHITKNRLDMQAVPGDVSTDKSLVGIVRKGVGFLYHPSLGSRKLSDMTSRFAVGAFIAGESSSGARAISKSARHKSTVTSIKGSTEGTTPVVITPNPDSHVWNYLPTGVTVQWKSADSLATFRNEARRWACIMPEKYFLVPRESYIPTNIFKIAEIIATGSYPGTNERTVQPDRVKSIYGSIARLLPLFIYGQTIPDQFLRGVKEAWEHDKSLYVQLNAVDFYTFSLSALQQIIGLIPVECAEKLCTFMMDTFNMFFTAILTGGDPAPTLDAVKDFLYNFFQDIAFCAIEAGFPPTEVIFTLVDVLSGLDWLFEDVILHGLESYFTLEAYTEVEFKDDNGRTCDLPIQWDKNDCPAQVSVCRYLGQNTAGDRYLHYEIREADHPFHVQIWSYKDSSRAAEVYQDYQKIVGQKYDHVLLQDNVTIGYYNNWGCCGGTICHSDARKIIKDKNIIINIGERECWGIDPEPVWDNEDSLSSAYEVLFAQAEAIINKKCH